MVRCCGKPFAVELAKRDRAFQDQIFLDPIVVLLDRVRDVSACDVIRAILHTGAIGRIAGIRVVINVLTFGGRKFRNRSLPSLSSLLIAVT